MLPLLEITSITTSNTLHSYHQTYTRDCFGAAISDNSGTARTRRCRRWQRRCRRWPFRSTWDPATPLASRNPMIALPKPRAAMNEFHLGQKMNFLRTVNQVFAFHGVRLCARPRIGSVSSRSSQPLGADVGDVLGDKRREANGGGVDDVQTSFAEAGGRYYGTPWQRCRRRVGVVHGSTEALVLGLCGRRVHCGCSSSC